MASKCMLHKSKLDEFKEWLVLRGYSQEKTKGIFEVLRMRFDKSNILIVYDRIEAKEHYTTHGLAEDMLKIWFKEKH